MLQFIEMKQTNAPQSRPSPSSKEQTRAVADKGSATTVFMSMVLDMSWRLIVVFLVPIIVGAELDKHLKVKYVYLILGFVLAIALATLVVYQSYKTANRLTANATKGKKT